MRLYVKQRKLNYQRKVINKQSMSELGITIRTKRNKNNQKNNDVFSKIEVYFSHKRILKVGSPWQEQQLCGHQGPRLFAPYCLQIFSRLIHDPLWLLELHCHSYIPGNKMQKGEDSLKLHPSYVLTTLWPKLSYMVTCNAKASGKCSLLNGLQGGQLKIKILLLQNGKMDIVNNQQSLSQIPKI